jgi:CRP-like cAMP-binding protein
MTEAAIVEGLAKSKLAFEMTAPQCSVLARSMTSRDLAAGEVLVREGATDDHLYVVVHGALGVLKAAGTDQELMLSSLRPGDVAGELSFLDGATRFASLVAMSETRVLSLSRGDLEALLDYRSTLVYRVMRAIVRVVHDIQRRLSMQAAELTNYLYKTHGRY